MKNERIRLVAVSIFFAALACAPEHRGNTFTEPPPPKGEATLTSLGVSIPATLVIGQTATAIASGSDQFGASFPPGPVVWTSVSSAVATVSGIGIVTAVAAGQTQIVAATNGLTAQASVNVVPVPVATVTVTPLTAPLVAGATQQLTVVTRDAANNVLTGRVVTWTAADASKATVDANGLVTAVAAGTTVVTATSEGKTGASQIIVTPNCNSGNALQLAVGGMHTLTAAEKAFLCLGGGASASEYALIPFNSNNVAASTTQFQVSATNTSAIQPGSLFSIQTNRMTGIRQNKKPLKKSLEWSFRERERRDLASAFTSVRRLPRPTSAPLGPRFLTNIPTSPGVGTVVFINGNLSGNACTAPKVLRGATVIAVLNKTIVLSDVTSPVGGYTNQEMIDFGTAFDTLGYGLDTLNFGTPTDIDGNGRVAILFTPSVNSIPAPPGAVVGGLFAGRDLEPVATCVASNEGEMFYMPVPDPNSTINGNYTDKVEVGRAVLPTLVHEFQHLINAGRRQFINNAPTAEELWLNEGLSHIAEELLYYRMSGNTPGSDIDLPLIQSSQAQIDAINTYQFDNLVRAALYMKAPETNSPYGQVDVLEMRGAIWQLLRYSADRKGGVESNTWKALVNSTTAGQTNFNAVFGSIITNARDMAIAQVADDAGLGLAANFTNPSWNFRSVLPVIFPPYPLLTHPLLSTPVNITLYGGGSAYLRFSVAASTPAIITGNASGQAVPPAIDFILLRTQ
ncbi:MAG: Ig-like domain-containing protein [Gemmatimonadaceae bacterium]